jgi:hypothetical protein
MDDNSRYSRLILVILICVIAIAGCSSSDKMEIGEPITAPAPAPSPALLDSDSDNVPDSLDNCPNTSASHKVDHRGCSVFVESENSYPIFPSQPPRPSIRLVGLKIQDFYNETSLLGLAAKITDNLSVAGYKAPAFYRLSKTEGIAIATQIERIQEDGTPFESSDRWVFNDMSMKWSNFSILEYLKALVGERAGYYRTIIILVKPKSDPLIFGDSLHSEANVKAIYTGGAAQPKADLIKVSTADMDMNFLIYEVKRSATGEEAAQVSLGISVEVHFEKSALKLWDIGDTLNE